MRKFWDWEVYRMVERITRERLGGKWEGFTPSSQEPIQIDSVLQMGGVRMQLVQSSITISREYIVLEDDDRRRRGTCLVVFSQST